MVSRLRALVQRLTRRRDCEREALADAAPRLAIAQHWARSAVLYPAEDPWYPVVMTCAIAALVTRDLVELQDVLEEACERMRLQTRKCQAWQSALDELEQTRAGVGAALEQSDEWVWSVLRASLLRHLYATQAIHDRIASPQRE